MQNWLAMAAIAFALLVIQPQPAAAQSCTTYEAYGDGSGTEGSTIIIMSVPAGSTVTVDEASQAAGVFIQFTGALTGLRFVGWTGTTTASNSLYATLIAQDERGNTVDDWIAFSICLPAPTPTQTATTTPTAITTNTPELPTPLATPQRGIMEATQLIADEQAAAWQIDSRLFVFLGGIVSFVLGFWLLMFIKRLTKWGKD